MITNRKTCFFYNKRVKYHIRRRTKMTNRKLKHDQLFYSGYLEKGNWSSNEHWNSSFSTRRFHFLSYFFASFSPNIFHRIVTHATVVLLLFFQKKKKKKKKHFHTHFRKNENVLPWSYSILIFVRNQMLSDNLSWLTSDSKLFWTKCSFQCTFINKSFWINRLFFYLLNKPLVSFEIHFKLHEFSSYNSFSS